MYWFVTLKGEPPKICVWCFFN